ncbi:MAG: transposase, partial [Methylobacter sp.]|nr:transposase [Methylobacter sp.]MDP3054983.1 transposase [Methylobacter sp.]MDP3363915.1 transposase [Methylobacter sp.]MDZ4219052.1 transposase [Methylobacter sp.]
MHLIEPILQQMSSMAKPQRKFMFILLTAMTYLPGRVNFRNLGRYTSLNEKTFSRWFRRPFDFVTFNLLSLKGLPDNGEWVAAIDASFSPKSGRTSYGLDWFWNGSQGQAERGLEISLLALVDVTHNTAYTLSAYQTPALPKAPKAPKVATESAANTEDKVAQDADKKTKTKATKTPKETRTTRIDIYLDHVKRDTKRLLGKIRYLVADSFYAKTKFINGVVEHGMHVVSKLRHDADLRWLYTGEQKAKGRPRQYAGKVCFDDLSRFELAGDIDGQHVYTAVVNAPTFKCNVRIVYVVREEKGKTYTALLFCTDIDCAAMDILRYYKARFQIEFVFRDAKQYTGLCDCQATSEAKLGFHFNASLAALNLLRLEDRHHAVEGAGRNVISIASWKTRKFNAHLLERFSCHLGLDFTAIKSSPGFAALCNYGA